MRGPNVEWLDGLNVRGIRPGLESITALLGALDDPQKGLRTIHVAGSDGKGSVCCMLESILISAGYRVGMFTSPQILKVNECIRMDGKDISDDLLEHHLSMVKEASERSRCQCTNFEALTACALIAFREEGMEISIVEVGMGGRLDCTDLVEPEVTVINNIGMEHTGYLGSTIEAIASEKAGIMKPGIPCVTINTGKALDVITEYSERLGCPLTAIDPSDVEVLENAPDHIMMRYCESTYRVSLPGRFQGRNAALAVEAIRSLKDSDRIMHFVPIGLDCASWPARMQKLEGLPIILDVTHTKKGAECLRKDIEQIYGKVVLVSAMLSDKDLDGVAELLSPIASKVYVSSPDSPRAADKDELGLIYRKHHGDVTVCPTVGDAVQQALKDEGTILVTGSFRTAEDCLKWLERTK